ncbi:uncharacterized protein LOC135143458 [Zophobas morio]|uniref:uncharacterized protein LOC135143458 n=1 Tax=Zophobas morio TaxID=2755281 RepID=UPI00308316A9
MNLYAIRGSSRELVSENAFALRGFGPVGDAFSRRKSSVALQMRSPKGTTEKLKELKNTQKQKNIVFEVSFEENYLEATVYLNEQVCITMTAPEGIFARDLLGLVESRWRKENISSGQSNVYSEISLSILIRSPLEAFALPLIGKPLLEIKKLSASGKYEKDLIDLYIIETKFVEEYVANYRTAKNKEILELHKKTVRSIISANEDEAIEDLMRSKFGEVPVLPEKQPKLMTMREVKQLTKNCSSEVDDFSKNETELEVNFEELDFLRPDATDFLFVYALHDYTKNFLAKSASEMVAAGYTSPEDFLLIFYNTLQKCAMRQHNRLGLLSKSTQNYEELSKARKMLKDDKGELFLEWLRKFVAIFVSSVNFSLTFTDEQLLGILESSSYSSSKATEKHDLSRRKKALEELNEAYECFDWNHVYQGRNWSLLSNVSLQMLQSAFKVSDAEHYNSVLEELQLFNKRPDFYYEIIRTRLSVAQNDMHPVFTESSMKENYERWKLFEEENCRELYNKVQQNIAGYKEHVRQTRVLTRKKKSTGSLLARTLRATTCLISGSLTVLSGCFLFFFLLFIIFVLV